MSAQAIAQPAIPFRTRSAVLAATALAVVLLAVSAGIAALVSDGASSGTAPSAAPPAAVASADSCPGDSGTLLTVVAAFPVAEQTPIMRSLSPQTAAMIRTAAESGALA